MGDERKQVFEAQGGQGFLVVALVADHRKGFGPGIADGLGHPVLNFHDLAELDFPMEVGQGRDHHVRAVGAAAELLPTAGFKACFAEHIAEHAFSSGSFLATIH